VPIAAVSLAVRFRRARGRRAVPGPSPPGHRRRHPALPALTWTRSAAARSPTGCSRCCWPAGMPASPLDSADSWDASPAWWWPPPSWLWWRSSSRPAGDSSAGRPALQPPPLRHRPHRGGVPTRLRDQPDLTTLTGELLAVVNQTVQPTRTSLWLRPQGAQARPWQRRPHPYRLRPADHQLAPGDGHLALDQGPDP
jgi:hypothetical protein